jgi:hypothetical protein
MMQLFITYGLVVVDGFDEAIGVSIIANLQ